MPRLKQTQPHLHLTANPRLAPAAPIPPAPPPCLPLCTDPCAPRPQTTLCFFQLLRHLSCYAIVALILRHPLPTCVWHTPSLKCCYRRGRSPCRGSRRLALSSCKAAEQANMLPGRLDRSAWSGARVPAAVHQPWRGPWVTAGRRHLSWAHPVCAGPCTSRLCDRNPSRLVSGGAEVAEGRSEEPGWVGARPWRLWAWAGSHPPRPPVRVVRAAPQVGQAALGAGCVSSRPTAAGAPPPPQLRLTRPIRAPVTQAMGPARPWAARRRAAARCAAGRRGFRRAPGSPSTACMPHIHGAQA